MKRLFSILFLAILLVIPTQAQNRRGKKTVPHKKKVALVLSGGGAKGVAHIGVIKVLEEAGIPIDIIVGTSMGSIVGGLYAVGYDASELDELVRNQRWTALLTDVGKVNDEEVASWGNIASDIWNGLKTSIGHGGLVSGKNLQGLFEDLCKGYNGKRQNFNKLPTPFACVATNVKRYEEYDFHEGSLPIAMRASMSIPGYFTPVSYKGMLLMDGGMRNNFPADIAKEMGADIIIGVSVQKDEEMVTDDWNSFSGILNSVVNKVTANKYDENWESADLGIRVDVGEYTTTSFSQAAINDLLIYGEQAGRDHWTDIMKLKKYIGL